MNEMFITSAADLRQCLPNQIAPAMGDPDLFDRLHPYLLEAQGWADTHLCTVRIAGDNLPLRSALRVVVASRAMHSAIGALDVVLTANGFGVVSTDTIAPASRDRVDAVRRDLERLCDSAILQALRILRKDPEWMNSPQQCEWGLCLLPPFSSEFEEEGYFSRRLYAEKAGRRAEVEKRLAERCLSHLVLDRLRRDVCRGTQDLPWPKLEIIAMVNEIVDGSLRNADRLYPLKRTSVLDIIDILRKNPELFPHWSESRQGRRFAENEGFRNDKKSSGFFF